MRIRKFREEDAKKVFNIIRKCLGEVNIKEYPKKDGKLLVVVSNPEADEMLPIDPDGCVTATLFNGKVSIKFPKHKLREYFSDEFKQNFQLLSKYEFSGNERDGSSDLIPNTLCFEASRK